MTSEELEKALSMQEGTPLEGGESCKLRVFPAVDEDSAKINSAVKDVTGICDDDYWDHGNGD